LRFAGRMARVSTSYEPRCPAGSVLRRIVQDHLETFPGPGGPITRRRRSVQAAFADWLRSRARAGMRASSSRPGQRDRLERVCRYALRPPVTPERLALTPTGRYGSH
jgi:hypothetical protein